MTKNKKVPALRFPGFEGEWEVRKLGNIGTFFSGGTPETTRSDFYNGKIPFIKSGEINAEKTEQFITEAGLKNSSSKWIQRGDLLYALYGATSGEVAISKMDGAINQAVLCIRTNEVPYFLRLFLELRKDKIIKTYLQGGQGNLSAQIVKSFKLHLPTLPEQQKIAAFLTAIDTRIQQLTRKKALLEQYKKGVMQKIFSRELRFRDEEGKEWPEWEVKRLGAYLEEYIERVPSTSNLPTLTSSRTGLGFQKDYFNGREVQNDGEYGVLPRGYFTYRHMSDDLIFQFNINNIVDRGAISKEYPVFKTNGMDSYFLQQALNFGSAFKKFAIIQKQGGTRTRLYFKNLAKFRFPIPILKEQQKIAAFLTALDAKINHVGEQITLTQTYKKGLLQRMFV